MPSEWDVGEFTTLVKDKMGAAHAEVMLPALESIRDKFVFCHYHYSRALELMSPHKKNLKDHFAQATAAMSLLFSQSEEERRQLVEALFGARAHSVAFAQCLHSTADYLAKVIYRGLDLRGQHSISIPNHQIGLQKVKKDISTIAELAVIKQRIEDYLVSPASRYLSAFVNTEKHHEIVDAQFSLSFSAGSIASAGIRMKAFQYRDENFGEKWAIDFFEKDFHTILERTTEVGCALNDYLKTK